MNVCLPLHGKLRTPTKSQDLKLVRTLARLRLQVSAVRKLRPRCAASWLSHNASRVTFLLISLWCGFDVSSQLPLFEQNSQVLLQHRVGEGSEVSSEEARFYFVFDAVNLFLVPHPCAHVEAFVLLSWLGFSMN